VWMLLLLLIRHTRCFIIDQGMIALATLSRGMEVMEREFESWFFKQNISKQLVFLTFSPNGVANASGTEHLCIGSNPAKTQRCSVLIFLEANYIIENKCKLICTNDKYKKSPTVLGFVMGLNF
jgi:hypothetical protein